MPTTTADAARHLLAFNQALVEQALALVAAHTGSGAPAYAGPVGSHLRHVIEHHEALLLPARPGLIDYDARPRDPALELSTTVATRRLQRLHRLLDDTPTARLPEPLRVRGQIGLDGTWEFESASCFGRELAFVASHAVHHFALLRAHLMQVGIALPAGFGIAPATRRHARGARPVACA